MISPLMAATAIRWGPCVFVCSSECVVTETCVRCLQHVLLNPQDGQKSKVSSGWRLYTSNDGYPYYFNHDSGQAEWAVFQRPESQAGAVKEPSSVMMVTSPDKEVAKKIARSLVEGKLAACVQLQDKVTSIYEWEGTVEESAEVLMIIKVSIELNFVAFFKHPMIFWICCAFRRVALWSTESQRLLKPHILTTFLR